MALTKNEREAFAVWCYNQILPRTQGQNRCLSILGAAQACLETGWGAVWVSSSSFDRIEHNNLFGIMQPGTQRLRRFSSVADGIEYWIRLLDNSSFYAAARGRRTTHLRHGQPEWETYLAFAIDVAKVYCPNDPKYGNKLAILMWQVRNILEEKERQKEKAAMAKRKSLYKTKTFWGGLAAIFTGVGLIVTGAVPAGIIAILGGMQSIFVRDAIRKGREMK